MARLAHDMAEKLMEIYRRNEKRYRLSHEAFKSIAGKTRLREAFVKEVDSVLREDGFVLVDLREEHGSIAVVKQSVPMKYDDLSDQMEEHFFVDEEWDEE